MPYISLMGALHGTDFDLHLDPMQHLSTESSETSRRPRLGQSPRVKPAVVCCTNHCFSEKKNFFILNDNKDKKHSSFQKTEEYCTSGPKFRGGGAFALPA